MDIKKLVFSIFGKDNQYERKDKCALSDDTLGTIISFLPLNDIIKCLFVSKQINHATNKNVWSILVKRDYKEYYNKYGSYGLETYKLCYMLNRLKSRWINSHTLVDIYEMKNIAVTNGRMDELSKDLGVLENLIKLQCNNFSIKVIPTELFIQNKLINLTQLNLQRNMIKEIPKEIYLLINLVDLQLADNEITEIPKELGKLSKLRYLQLQHNKIKKIPNELVQLKKLEMLLLFDNQIELPNGIPEGIYESRNIKRFVIDRRDIRYEKNQIRVFIFALVFWVIIMFYVRLSGPHYNYNYPKHN